MAGREHAIKGDLATEEGCILAAVVMGRVVSDDVLGPVMDHTPQAMQARLLELFMMAVTGSGCAIVGSDQMKAILDAAKLGIEDVKASRQKTH